MQKSKKELMVTSLVIVSVVVVGLVVLYWRPLLFPVSYPSQKELVDYALDLINSDRSSANIQNVSLSSVDSAQRHADDMLENHYFSHWNTQGYKPYVRYTLAGGKGAVDENIAWQSGDNLDVKQAIKDLEWSMMNDDAEFEWGHRDNIMDFFHNKVSIGIAFDVNNVYLVQDFEADYVTWETLAVSGSKVIMNGSIAYAGLTIRQIGIFYDHPSNLSLEMLATAPFNWAYDAGLFVGSVVPSQWVSRSGISVTAESWNQAGLSFQIVFDLSSSFAQRGTGVYTLYMFVDETKSLTSYSILI